MFATVWAILVIVGVGLVLMWARQGRSAMPRASVAAGPVWIGSGVVLVVLIGLFVAAVISNLTTGSKVNVVGDVLAAALAAACLTAFVVGLRRHR